MRYHVLACDYDGTLAHHGRVDEATLAALERLRQSGRKLIMVTGRELDELFTVFPQVEMFERIVAENGALLYRPATREERSLGERPPDKFVELLKQRGVGPISVGRVIVATWEPHETTVLETIRDLGLELEIIFNKGAVMVLPSGINKATGLGHALAEMGLSAHNTVGVGDAENDHAFLSLCECGVAVANALPMLKERADLVTAGDHGVGVGELISKMIETDLKEVEPRLARHEILFGTREDGGEVRLKPYGLSVLVAGTSGGGKSTLATGFMERLAEHGYQFCIIDPEGDYQNFEGAVVLGNAASAPSVDEVIELLGKPDQNGVVNMLGISMKDRPPFFETLFPRLQQMRARTARPHWILIDETHHLLPSSWDSASLTLTQEMHGLLMITVHPDRVSPAVLGSVDVVIVIGADPEKTIGKFSETIGERPPAIPVHQLEPGEAIVWSRSSGQDPFWMRSIPPRRARVRHLRKYAEGDLGPERSFYFRGPEGKLHLQAQNLTLFLQMAEGVDDQTWLYHLRNGDYSQWFRERIKDEKLAAEAARVEKMTELSAEESRALIKSAIKNRYTAPA
jgi:HAD superfamily hydrolase (TIGR01484 family)